MFANILLLTFLAFSGNYGCVFCWSTSKLHKLFKSSIIATGTAASIFNLDIIPTNIHTTNSIHSSSIANADARLNAPTAAGTRVNSDPESLLRYALPINNKPVRDIQASIESIKSNLKTRRQGFAKSDLDNAKALLTRNGAKIVAEMPQNHRSAGTESLSRLMELTTALQTVLTKEASTGTGSIQQRDSLDEAFLRQDNLAKELSVFEELLVADDFQREIPAEYKDLGIPALQGRAVVEMVIKNEDGSAYDVDGVLYDKVKISMVVDGYNAPLTAGNFVDLVKKGFYNNKLISRSDGFVVQTGDADPEGSVHGYVPAGASKERTIPLEISLKDSDEILYGVTTEDDGRGYAATALPFQSYGAMGMATTEYEANTASSQFFWLLFESDLTPAGKNLLDGRYTCFGYTTDGADLLKGVKLGNIIESAKVISGSDKLKSLK